MLFVSIRLDKTLSVLYILKCGFNVMEVIAMGHLHTDMVVRGNKAKVERNDSFLSGYFITSFLPKSLVRENSSMGIDVFPVVISSATSFPRDGPSMNPCPHIPPAT